MQNDVESCSEKKESLQGPELDPHHNLEEHLQENLKMAGPSPAPELLEAMGLAAASNQHPVEEVKLTSYTRKTALKDALVATNQEVRIAPMGDIIFSTAPAVYPKFSRCNYSISLVNCTASVPGAGPAGIAVDL